ncbi:MAG: T9SS type A sorting domain-containing protein, partial [Ignavibacteriaceae bacterium]|nr:T9SS type A sorting domain-containing protein [Ignavibacteriaceae bacterium]
MKPIIQIYLFSLISIINLQAQTPWVPDPNFGNNGIMRINFGTSNNDSPNDMLLLPDDRILTAGQSTSSFDYFIAMSQLLPNGQPDLTGFGTDGEVLLHFVLRDHANDIERQEDGKILVVGSEAVGNGTSQNTPALYRFESNGMLDTAFADSGKAIHRFTGDSAGELYGIKVLTDGRIFTAGASFGTKGFGAMRFLPDGELDPNFGVNGIARINYSFGYHSVSCLFLADTAIVMVTVDISPTNFVLAMMDSSGNPHPAFGNNGIVETDFEGKYNFSGGESLALTDDGKIILAGTTPNAGPTKFSVFRFNLDGTIDSTFGTDGRADIQFTSNDICYDMKLDSDGKILLVGRVSQGFGTAGLARLNPDGSPDTTFAPGGKFTINLNNNSGTHYLTTFIPLDNGDILAAGYDFASNAGDFMVTRLTQNPTGIDDGNPEQPDGFVLYQNYPNPFNPTTTIRFEIPEDSRVTLKIFNILGEEVKTLVEEYREAGKHSVQFNANNLSSGIYFY